MKVTAKTKGFILSIVFILLCNGAGFCENETRFVFASCFSELSELSKTSDFPEEGIEITKQKISVIENVTEWAKGSPSTLLGETVLKIYDSNSRIARTQNQRLIMDTSVAVRKNLCRIFYEFSCLMCCKEIYTEYKVAGYIHKLDGKKK